MVLMLTSSPEGWSWMARVPRRILPRVHEVEQSPCVVGDGERERGCVNAPGGGETGDSVRDPGGFVALAAIGDPREVWRVGLGEAAIVRHETQQVVVRPLPEGDDAAEGDMPADVERRAREVVAPGVTVQHAAHPLPARFADHRDGVVLGVARMDDDGDAMLVGEGELRGEGRALAVARRMIVVVIESAFADGDGAARELAADGSDVTHGVEAGGVVRVDAGGMPDEAGVRGGDRLRALGGGERFADADDASGAGVARPGDDGGAIGVEGRIGEVGVAVDEAAHERRNAAGQLAGGVSLPNAWSG